MGQQHRAAPAGGGEALRRGAWAAEMNAPRGRLRKLTVLAGGVVLDFVRVGVQESLTAGAAIG